MKKYLLIVFLIGLTINLYSQNEFSQENAEKILKTIAVDIGPRPMGSPAEQRALKFAVDKFKSYGLDTAYIMPMTFTSRTNTNSGIAVGIKKGLSKRIIVIGGHIDTAGPEVPGADDNGSGSAVVIELARIISKREMQSTIVFTLFGGEEQGLQGSRYFVDNFSEIDSVVLMLQIDMANGLGWIEIDPDTRDWSAPKWLVEAAVEEYKNLGYKNLIYPNHAQTLNKIGRQGASTDHKSFLDYGIPAIAFVSDITKPIHTPQDNLLNFDPRGLKRSGDLGLRLIERFDSGVPYVDVEEYWLYLIGSTPIFLLVWALTVFVIFSIVITFIFTLIIRKRRLIVIQSPIIDSLTNKPIPNPRGWSVPKMILFTLIPIIFAVAASDLMGWLKTVRFPWFTDLTAYIFYSILFGLAGLWFSLLIEKKLRLSKCPYLLFKRSVIILFIILILFFIKDIRLAIYPATALLLISLAAAIKIQFFKIIFFALSPIWMFRLIFSEWYPFPLRMSAQSTFLPSQPIINIFLVIVLFIITLPFFFAFASVYRETPVLKTLINKFRTIKYLIFLVIIIGLFSIYLYTQPVYNDEWYKTIKIEQTYDMNERELKISLRSFEYLDSVKIKHAKRDTLLLGKIFTAKIDPISLTGFIPFDTSIFKITRCVKQIKSDDTTYFNIDLQIFSKIRPYTINVTYKGNEEFSNSYETNWIYMHIRDEFELNWYSYPEMPLKIPSKFFIAQNDTIKESIEITYSNLLYPMEFAREKTNFIKRSIINQNFEYFRD